MIRILLCDSNPAMLIKYQSLLNRISQKKEYQISIETFCTSESLLFKLMDQPNYADLIFMETKIGNANGIEIARKLRALNCYAEIIFATMYKDYVFDSFEVSPFYYILKQTVSANKFEEIVLNAFHKILEKKKEFFYCKTVSTQKTIPIHLITHFSLSGRIATVHYDKKEFEFYSSIKKLEETLDSRTFARCHRSYIVNLNHIEEITSTVVTLKNGMQLPMGGSYFQQIKSLFSDSEAALTSQSIF